MIDVAALAAVVAFGLLLSIVIGDGIFAADCGVGCDRIAETFSAGSGAPVGWLFVRTHLDNALVVAYLAMFVAGAASAFPARPEAPLVTQLAKTVPCVLAVGAAAVDLFENFVLFALTGKHGADVSASVDIPKVCNTKWALFLTTAALSALFFARIRAAYRARWPRKSA